MKSVTLTLAPTTFVVDGNTNEELLENAKKAFIKQIPEKFPHITYAVNNADVLKYDEAFAGLIVETNSGDKGIVTAVNRKNLIVTLTGHRSVTGAPEAFKQSSASFEEARSYRPEFMKPVWSQGDTGYIKTKDGIFEVIVGKKSGQKTKVHIIGSKEYFPLTSIQMENHLKDTKDAL